MPAMPREAFGQLLLVYQLWLSLKQDLLGTITHAFCDILFSLCLKATQKFLLL